MVADRNCWCCDAALTVANYSNEHIFLNACGGRLKSKWLLCKDCNSLFGNKFDHELATQVNDIMNYLMIKRDRKLPQPIIGKLDADGAEYKQLANGDLIRSKPEVRIDKDGSNIKVHISASNDEQFNEVINGLIRKYPFLKKKEILDQAKRSNYYLNEPLNSSLSIGGPEAFQSIVKTAINFFIYKGGDAQYIKNLIPYLKGEENPTVAWYYFNDSPPFSPKKNEVNHIIKLVGDPAQKILYAYVELFNYMNVIVLLNDSYTGADIDETYALELISLIETKPAVILNLNRDSLLAIFSEKRLYHPSEILSRLNKVWLIADEIQTQFHLNKLIKGAVLKAYKEVSKGTFITQEIFDEMLEKVNESLAPFIAHVQNRTAFKMKIKDRQRSN